MWDELERKGESINLFIRGYSQFFRLNIRKKNYKRFRKKKKKKHAEFRI